MIKFEPVGGRFWADIEADLTSELSPHVLIQHLPRTLGHGFVCEHERIDLVWTATPFGGRRWWFRCPAIGRRVGTLYLPEGERKFLSREAYGLGYQSQRMTTEQRLRRKGLFAEPRNSRQR